jgi:electron transfer flavoprotein alpha subunit
MSVLIYIDNQESKIKKSALEVLSYGAAIAGQMQVPAIAFVAGPFPEVELKVLGEYGAAKVLHAPEESLKSFDSGVFTALLQEAAIKEKAAVIVLPHNFHGRGIAPLLSVKLKAGLVTGTIALPETSGGFIVRKTVFSGKAIARIRISTPIKILTLSANSFASIPSHQDMKIERFTGSAEALKFSLRITGVHADTDEIPLSEAEIIVSGGRGMKGPENWGILEDLAHALGAATACSRPVADADWRPHHEHVGQTGLTVRPNLYIALGISGAIQHLAGVNGSKVIVVINRDPEAPFFKSADYGIVGDVFQVVPALTAAVKQLKS